VTFSYHILLTFILLGRPRWLWTWLWPVLKLSWWHGYLCCYREVCPVGYLHWPPHALWWMIKLITGLWWFLTCISHTAHVIDIGWTSVCPSHAGIVLKRLNLSSNCLHWLRTKLFSRNSNWNTPNEGIKCKGVGKSCNFRPISRYSS